ncbi:hypothetical protein BJA5080_07842 [Bradyrhizobium diazoefficiens SEMIA 5080]|uniref:Uncharacterized protein n=1 Tax=Bradyrhizobium diazoefficiens SEMIA 5080 TaxID=754504 RepID=A0A837CRB3_9BRAD|nr:hypothetical protein BJA5080_07842 [Bradyrhizobium diazoefficiens SEMIA 5080]
MKLDQAALEALALTPLRGATVLSMVPAAFSSFRFGEEAHDIIVTKLLGPGAQRAVRSARRPAHSRRWPRSSTATGQQSQ